MVRPNPASAPDRAQFEAVYAEHHAFVGRCLARWGVPAAWVDDARQDVFLTAFRKLHTFEGHASIRAWLAGISRRVAWRHRRTRDRHARRIDALSRVEPEVASVDDWIRRREAGAVLDAFLHALDVPKREAFVLCELEGLSAREAASATGVNPATLYSRLRVARSSFETMCASLNNDGIQVSPGDAATIHRRAHPEDPAALRRGWALLGARLGGSAVKTTTVLSKPVVAWVLGLGVTSAAVVGGVAVSSSPPPRRAEVVASAFIPERAPIEASPPVAPAVAQPPVPEKPRPEPAPPRRNRSRPPEKPEPDALAQQVEQLAEVDEHLRHGEWKDALAAASSFVERWPNAPLAADAVRAAARAHCQLGSTQAAVALVRKHLPSTDAEAWVAQRCKKTAAELMNPTSSGD